MSDIKVIMSKHVEGVFSLELSGIKVGGGNSDSWYSVADCARFRHNSKNPVSDAVKATDCNAVRGFVSRRLESQGGAA